MDGGSYSIGAHAAGKALSLFVPQFRVFNMDRLDDALTHLQLIGADRARVARALDDLRSMPSPTSRPK
jgi:hypothetical protein